jgi:hypothetical protein
LVGSLVRKRVIGSCGDRLSRGRGLCWCIG